MSDQQTEQQATRHIEVTEIETGEVVHRIDVTGKSESHIERAIRGMLTNMDRDRFCVGTSDDAAGAGSGQ